MDLFKPLFLIKPVKVDKYEQKMFSPQNEPQTAKLCLSVVLKHFGKIQRELFFLDIKVTISKLKLKYSETLFFYHV